MNKQCNQDEKEPVKEKEIDLRVEELEEVIAPRLAANHNQTLVRAVLPCVGHPLYPATPSAAVGHRRRDLLAIALGDGGAARLVCFCAAHAAVERGPDRFPRQRSGPAH